MVDTLYSYFLSSIIYLCLIFNIHSISRNWILIKRRSSYL